MAPDSNGSDIESVRKDMEALKQDFSKLISDVRTATTERAEKLYGDLREDAPKAVRDRVRARPIASLAVAFLAGALVASFLRR
jgi:hypothetical protein